MSTETTEYTILDVEPDTTEWLRLRKGGLGASEAAAILGLSKWGTPLSVYLDKMTGAVDNSMSDWQDWGHRLEEPIAQWVRDKKHLDVAASPGLVRSNEYPWLIATPDRRVIEAEQVPLEIKTSDAFMRDSWNDGIPLNYQIQLQQQMLILGASYGYMAVLHGGNSPDFYRVERDQEFLDMLIERTRDFWNNHILAEVPPDPISTAETADAYPGEPDTSIEGSEALYELWGAYGLLQAEAVELNEKIDGIKLQLQLAMKDATELTYAGQTLFTWKPQKGKAGFDHKALAKDDPDTHAKYVTQGKPTRTFLRKKEKNND